MKYLFFVLFAGSLFLTSCKNKSEAVETTDAQPVAEASGKTFNVVPAQSNVLWVGTKPTGQHNGTFPVKEGSLTVENDMISSGTFVIDMTNLTVDDLQGDEKAKLESHLKGTGTEGQEDFFNVSKFPTATFALTKVTGLANDANANAIVSGNLTLMDVTKEISFKANINILDNNITVTTPPFTINRTDWGLKYSSKTFADLEDKFIHDDVTLQVNLNAVVSQ